MERHSDVSVKGLFVFDELLCKQKEAEAKLIERAIQATGCSAVSDLQAIVQHELPALV